MKKRLFCILLSLTMIITMMPAMTATAFAGSTDVNTLELSVNPYGNRSDSIDTIKWSKVNFQYYFFLPADCDASQLTLYHNSSEDVYVDGVPVENGEKTDVFKEYGKHEVTCGKRTYTLNVMKGSSIPSVYISTEQPLSYINADKSNKSKGKIKTYENGEMVLEESLKQIKGRGNSTWMLSKKPYNIKFDEKQSLLGMDEAKKWTLLAQYYDPAFIRNPIAWEIANMMEIAFSSDYKFADLYINGEYIGEYIICESVEVGDKRVKITDLEKATENVNDDADLDKFPLAGNGEGNSRNTKWKIGLKNWVDIPNNPTGITGGYLLECDYSSRIMEEASAFVTAKGQSVTVKAPEYASKEQVEYISKYWQEMEDAICSEDGKNALGKHYTEYLDIDSFANMYIFVELSGNVDGGLSSTYFYKDKDDVLKAGPIWDLDLAFGRSSLKGNIFTNDPTRWLANKMNYGSMGMMPTSDEYPTIFNSLFRRADFREKVFEKWAKLRNNGFSAEAILGKLEKIADSTKESAIMNGVRWSQTSTEAKYQEEADSTRVYIAERIKCLDIGFGKNGAQLFYDANGGIGWSTESKILRNGDIVFVNGPYSGSMALGNMMKIRSMQDLFDALIGRIEAPSENLEFAGWNTKADGTGREYEPGELIIAKGTITLYAQWKPKSDTDKSQARQDGYRRALIVDNPLVDMADSALNVYSRKMLYRLHQSR